MGTLDGKGALVTGGSRGIGRAIVNRLAAEGAAVVFSYLQNEDAARAVVRDVDEAGGRAFAVRAGQGSLDDLRRLTGQASRRTSPPWSPSWPARIPAGSPATTCPPTEASWSDPRLVLMSTMDQWTAAVCADLGLDPSSADLRAVLDLTRDVAHGVARPAAPLTAYLVGVAVGRGLALPDAAGRIAALAAGWGGEGGEEA